MTNKEIMEFSRELHLMDGLTDKAIEVIENTEYQLLPELFYGLTADEINKFIDENY